MRGSLAVQWRLLLSQGCCKIAKKRGSKGQPPLCGGLGASPSLFFLPRPQGAKRLGNSPGRNMPGSSQPCYNAAELTISTFFDKGENSELGETRFSLPQLFAGKAALVCLSHVSSWKISKATAKLPLIFGGAPPLSVDLMEQAKPLLLKLLVLPSSAFYPTTTRNLY